MLRFLCVLLVLAAPATADVTLSQYGMGDGPRQEGETVHLLDAKKSQGQCNTAAWDRHKRGAFRQMTLRCTLAVGKGADGGGIAFLSTRRYGAYGPAPFRREWEAPSFAGSFGVGIDVYNPPTKEMFGAQGNYRGEPQREVSLHWDGRELVKRRARTEFRDKATPLAITVDHVPGGALVTVTIGEETLYDRYFVAKMHPYPARLAVGARTGGVATTFSVSNVQFGQSTRVTRVRPPLHVELFNHKLTDNKTTKYRATVDLPPADWAFARVLITIQIHDAGKDWDEWDRNGELSIVEEDGTRRGIVPFITSYRTECHWVVDVTCFRPYLAGKTTFEIAAGTTFYKNRGYMMSASLDYYHGRPAQVPYKIVPLWHGTARYQSAENHFKDFFPTRTVEIPEGTTSAVIRTTTTGHSQVGEFTPSKRELSFAQGEKAQTFLNTLWRDDCYLNPNRPQFGTWKFSRAGWAPGDVVRPWWVPLKGVAPGKAEISYTPRPYTFSGARQPTPKQIAAARHVVRSFLILYRDSKGLRRAPTLVITNVAKDSNAMKAGMKTGDYLASYDGKQVDSIDDLRAAIQGAVAAKKAQVTVVVFRAGAPKELTLTVGRMGINLGQR